MQHFVFTTNLKYIMYSVLVTIIVFRFSSANINSFEVESKNLTNNSLNVKTTFKGDPI